MEESGCRILNVLFLRSWNFPVVAMGCLPSQGIFLAMREEFHFPLLGGWRALEEGRGRPGEHSCEFRLVGEVRLAYITKWDGTRIR